MSIALADALADVDLEVSQTYHCEVHGRHVELRVLAKPEPSTGLSEDDVMLDPWCELPRPRTIRKHSVRRVERLPYDIPVIPVDDDDDEVAE